LPDLRKDPITGRWVIISTDRARRPSDFNRQQVRIKGDRFCPFCAGHETKTPPEVLAFRPAGQPNSPGWTLRAVPNKFPALRVEGDIERQGEGLYDRMNGVGAHEVIIESPDHNDTLASMSEVRVADLFFAVRDRINDLARDPRLRYMLVFKNHGEGAGATLEHTHTQLIALPIVPKRVHEEIVGARRYYEFRDRCVYCDIIQQEIATATRVIISTEHFLVIAPYASSFPFECWILPRRHSAHFHTTPPEAIHNLGWVMRTIAAKYDKTLEYPPYNFVLHTTPIREGELEHYHWHIEIAPKLTRVAGFEWGSSFFINPTPPEEAAQFLREANPD
jgi:UDPglucose--hexose-1-phosphate uridylyltransferase